MKFYKLFVEVGPWTVKDEELMVFLSNDQQKKVRKYRKAVDQKLSLYSALLIIAGGKKVIGETRFSFELSQTETGKPFFVNYPTVYFNISHSGEVVICGFSNQTIGVDVEKIGKVYPEVISDSFHEVEQCRYMDSSNKEKTFYEVWTRKEAYVKFDGSGIAQDLTLINTYKLQEELFFQSWNEGGYQFSICSYKEEKIVIINVKPEEIYAYFYSI